MIKTDFSVPPILSSRDATEYQSKFILRLKSHFNKKLLLIRSFAHSNDSLTYLVMRRKGSCYNEERNVVITQDMEQCIDGLSPVFRGNACVMVLSVFLPLQGRTTSTRSSWAEPSRAFSLSLWRNSLRELDSRRPSAAGYAAL